MLDVTRSELVRLRRRSVLLGWFGLTALAAVMITAFLFTAAARDGGAPQDAPGVSFPSAADLAAPDGYVAGVGGAATLLGVVSLSYWAIATASDSSTGLVRLLVQAQPDRLRLLGGKLLALTSFTAVAAAVAVAAVAVASPAVARGTGSPTGAWELSAGTLAGSWSAAFLALTVWGVIGLVIATLTRSAAAAIASGVAYVLVVEGVIGLVAADVADRLPGATLTAVVDGGSAAISQGTAVALALGYAAVGVLVAGARSARREITD